MESRDDLELETLRYEEMFPEDDERSLSNLISDLQSRYPDLGFEEVYERAQLLLEERNTGPEAPQE